MTGDALDSLTLAGAARRIRSGQLSPVDLTERVLERIERLNPKTNAFIRVTGDSALAAAREVERTLAKGKEAGPLAGVPISLKDLFDTAGVPTTAGSRVFAGRIPPTDAAVVAKLKAAGAVIVGKTNLHEFAYGVTSVNPHYGPVRNPWDPERISGGSSGGSAVSVALAMALGSVGTDTGGSIRIPSALSGTVGLKPTYGRVSGTGVLPLAWSFDTFGPITRTVEDAALMLEVIAGFDVSDPRTEWAPASGYVSEHLEDGVRGLRFGVPRNAFDRTDPEVASLVRAALGRLESLGAALVDVDLAGQERHEPVFRDMAGFEVLAFHEDYLAQTPEAYGPDTRARIERGRQVAPRDYLAARRERMRLQNELHECFEEVDLVALPTLPLTAPRIGEDPVAIGDLTEPVLSALTRNNRLFSVTGVPAISVPCGLTSSGLPVGLQIAGRMFDETRVLRAAWAYEQDAEWERRLPALS